MNKYPTPSASSGQALATKARAWRGWGTLCLTLAALALPAAARTRPHYGGALRVEVEGDAWQKSGGMARRLVLDGLTRMDADGAARPALAARWASESNDHRWQFWLRPGVHFSDGSALTSSEVVSSLGGGCGTNCPWTAIHAIGSSVVFTSDSPMPNLPALLASDEYLIALTESLSGTSPGAAALPGPVGTGPFELTEFKNGVANLAANDSCWQGRPFVDRIEIVGHKSIRDQWLDLSVGRADLVEVPAEQLRQAREQHLTAAVSPPVELLALAVADGGVLGDPHLRAAIALAVDRGALSNVIFQKQGEITASMLPSALTGYSFLFSADRDLNKARELRGGLTPPPLTLSTDGGAAMQLAAQRIALNLREAGFNVQVAGSGRPQHTDLVLLRLTLASSQPRAGLESLLRGVGVATPVQENDPAGLYRVEREFLETHTLIPLLYLPRAYAASGRVRDLRLSPDGAPLLGEVSLEDAP
jgi:MarR-like DNA-binding transcriptional regulator SgrR of sgrS sRNA